MLSPILSPCILLLIPLLYYLLPYLRNRPIRDVPGPKLAAFSNLWLLYQCRLGRRYLAVDNAHKRYGPLVRLQPNHVSVADPGAIGVIYSHTGGWLKRSVNVLSPQFTNQGLYSMDNRQLTMIRFLNSAITTTPLSPSAAASSTPAPAQNTRASGRPSPIPSPPSQLLNSSLIYTPISNSL